jgi:hypothetical protein
MSIRKSVSLALAVWIAVTLMLTAIGLSPAGASPVQLFTDPDATPPAQPVKLIFIHHSTGENWLTDGYGNLGSTLGDNNYFVSDTNYGWGPDSIGDRTDIPNWTEWFRSASTPTYMSALYTENGKHSTYTRTLANPGGENEIIMFKSCFPNSELEGNPDDPPSASGWLTVGHAKYVYNQLLVYFGAHPEKLFVVITAPPVQSHTYAANARAFNQWLMNDWLTENGYTLSNVAVFDFYNVLTGLNHHHRYFGGAIEHVFTPGANTLYYPTSSGDNHPNVTGSRKATNEFVPLLNIFYHRWYNSLWPRVTSIVRSDPNMTNAASVNFTVTFSETVIETGVDATDFTLVTDGLTGTSITAVTGSGTTYTVTADTGTGSGIMRLDVVDDDTILDADSNPLGGTGSGNGNFTNGQTYIVRPLTLTFSSAGTRDGWILESTETSKIGSTKNSTASTLRLGDDAGKKQYRSILSFATGSGLPDDAVITAVTLKIRKQGVIGGGNPVTTFQGFMTDIKKGYFGTSALQTADFQTAASKTYGPFKPTLSSNWYSIDLTGGKSFINKLSTGAGLTQIRLRFKLDDNNNTAANYLKLYSGNAGSSYRPQLIVAYYDP